MKIPLIKNCVKSKSTKGLSETSVTFEIISLLIWIIYNAREAFPLSTYGELLSVIVQNVVLVGCFWYYNPTTQLQVAKSASKFVMLTTVLSALPSSLLFMLPVCGMMSSWSSQIPQILLNYRAKNTGNLSIETQSAQAFGAIIRTITILIEVNDPLALFASVIGSTLQALIFSQIVYYQYVKGSTLAEEKAEAVAEDTKTKQDAKETGFHWQEKLLVGAQFAQKQAKDLGKVDIDLEKWVRMLLERLKQAQLIFAERGKIVEKLLQKSPQYEKLSEELFSKFVADAAERLKTAVPALSPLLDSSASKNERASKTKKQ